MQVEKKYFGANRMWDKNTLQQFAFKDYNNIHITEMWH